MLRAWVFFAAVVLVGCGRDSGKRCAQTLCPGDGSRLDCVDPTKDAAHCGECGKACSDSELCQTGSCVPVCGSGEVNCDGRCVSLGSSSTNCGRCDQACGDAQECVDGECLDIQPPPKCPRDECNPPCEEDECDPPCEGDDCDPLCEGDECDPPLMCDADKTVCNDRCVNLEKNESHCGRCGRSCASGETCVEGTCECVAPQQQCWFECLALDGDPSNCGSCGQLCENGTICESGSCGCPEGLSSCDGSCVDEQASRLHCGGCGIECTGAQICDEGICALPGASCSDEARGVSIVRVAAYQGVEVEFAMGADLVATNERAVDLVQGRDALFRVFVEPLDGFAAGDYEAHLTVNNGAGASTYVAPTRISAASTQADLSSTVNVFVPGAELSADAELSLELFSCGTNPGGDVGVSRVPAVGLASVDATPSDQMEVTFVPVRHDGVLPDTSLDTLEAYAREVERQFPTTEVEITVSDPIDSAETGIIPDLGVILDQITDKKADDMVENRRYYYGLVDPASSVAEYCDGGCTTGIAWVIEGLSGSDLAHRTGVGIGFGTYGANTFAHELGHNIGRDHAPCGTSGDDNYPYAGALIGSWGYDPLGGILKDPTEFTDVMSYCEPNWVSDYSYQAILERLAMGPSARVSGPERNWGAILVTKSGARWSRPLTVRGAPTPHREIAVVYDALGDPLLEVEVYTIKMGDEGGYKLFVPPEQPGWGAIGLRGGQALRY